MALFGLGSATIVAMIAGIRSSKTVNKLLIMTLWGVFAAFSLGVRL